MRDTDAHISRLTGQVFGPTYLDGLLVDPASVWWSRPTVAAVLAAEAVRADAGVAMVKAIQHAHYVAGQPVVDDEVLVVAAATAGLDTAAFRDAIAAVPVDRHIQDTRSLMRRHGLQGFPSFLLERDGILEHLPHEGCYGRPDAFVAAIRAAVLSRLTA
ncbi:DsbA family protein [uncultured Sphingomonas sp.]|uniref:DsbA family protein n=1 Tax=uncultured Sphingomonas sp. TaxID=158754 RepID=UPI0035CC9AD3